MDRWQGRIALVTGASVGIGAAICRRLVKHNMKVVGCARNEDKIKDIAEELKSQSGKLYAYKCDVTKDEEVIAMFDWIRKELGGVDICINNAGLAINESLLDGKPESWRYVLDVNVVALCLCSREAVKSMNDRGVDDGQIIHINSLSGHRVTPSSGVHFYAASKHAVTALTEGLRQELRERKSHIRVASISPGLVQTEFQNRMGINIPFLKGVKPIQADDIAEITVQIISAPPHVQIHDIMVRPTEQPT